MKYLKYFENFTQEEIRTLIQLSKTYIDEKDVTNQYHRNRINNK